MMTMPRSTVISLLFILLAATQQNVSALSSVVQEKPLGSAATPIKKQKVAVFGAGGYLGACAFGYLQRAASLYGTGLGDGITSPRNICATSRSSQLMNRVLGKNFVLSYAGEQHVRLTDMTSVQAIAARLEGYGAVVIGTMYSLEERPVTGGSYEKNPNDKTLEFYLDEPKGGIDQDKKRDYDMSVHYEIFENTLEACKAASIQHAVVIETPGTTTSDAFISRLAASGIPCTYIRCNGELSYYQDHTHYKGIQGDLSIQSAPLTDTADDSSTKGAPIYREDVAALVCQSLQSLDWTKSQCLTVTSSGDWKDAVQGMVKGRQDRQWCANSRVLAGKLASA
jgi:hypothetical protein